MTISAGRQSRLRFSATITAAIVFGLVLSARPVPATAQEDDFDDLPASRLKAGDKIELRSGQQGTVISVEGAKAKVLLTVPLVDLVIPGRRAAEPPPRRPRRPGSTRPGFDEPDEPLPRRPFRPGTSRPGFDDPDEPLPQRPREDEQAPAFFGTWLSTDRAVVIKNATDFRIFWTDESGSVRIDDGRYLLRENPEGGATFFFTVGETTWPWHLQGLDATSMALSHDQIGRRTFRRVQRNDKHPFAATWDVLFNTTRGARGTAKFYLYRDGMYVIDEYKENGKFDHREFGSWTADPETGVQSMTFPYQNKLNTTRGTVRATDFDHIVWTFPSLGGDEYTYYCRRRTKLRDD